MINPGKHGDSHQEVSLCWVVDVGGTENFVKAQVKHCRVDTNGARPGFGACEEQSSEGIFLIIRKIWTHITGGN